VVRRHRPCRLQLRQRRRRHDDEEHENEGRDGRAQRRRSHGSPRRIVPFSSCVCLASSLCDLCVVAICREDCREECERRCKVFRARPINLAISQAKLSRAQHTRQVIQQSCLSSYSKYNFKFMQDPLAIFYCPHFLSQPGSGGGTHNCRAVQATGAACSDKLILFPPSSLSHVGIC